MSNIECLLFISLLCLLALVRIMRKFLKKYFGLFGVGHPLWGLPHSNHLGIIE